MPRYSQERKAAVLKKLLPPHNRTVVSVAAEEGIADVTLYKWLKQCRERGMPVPGQTKTGDDWRTPTASHLLLLVMPKRCGYYLNSIQSIFNYK
jgi:transposase-like protein